MRSLTLNLNLPAIVIVLSAAVVVGSAVAQDFSSSATAESPVPVQAISMLVDSTRVSPAESKTPSPHGSAVSCERIEVRAVGALIFADSFESGDVLAWTLGNSFSLRSVVDLNLTVVFDQGLSGDHTLHVKLTTPKGHHYQTLTSAISAAEGVMPSAPPMRRVPGFPLPLVVDQLSSTSDGLMQAHLTLPLAGTQIVTHSLYGEWQAEAFLNERQVPCGPGKSFVLNP